MVTPLPLSLRNPLHPLWSDGTLESRGTLSGRGSNMPEGPAAPKKYTG